MPNTVTYTGKTGPAVAVTAVVVNNVSKLVLDIASGMLQVFTGGETYKEFELKNVATLTDTITAGVHAIIISE